MPPDTTLDIAMRLAIAALVGLAIGIEREWSGKARGPGARFAGVRTFFLIGTLGGVVGWFTSIGLVGLSVSIAAGTFGLVVTAYAMAAWRDPESGVEGTTEVAALLVVALGVAAGLGFFRIASASAAVVVLALAEKTRIEAFVRRIGRKEMRAALTFAVFALVVLPILPQGPYGPLGGIRPRILWAVVLLFLALNFGGYVARRIAGDRAGYRIAGFIGGTFSSTLVSFSFSQQSRKEPALATPLAIGVVAACTLLIPRVAVVTSILNADVALTLLPILGPPLAVGVGILMWDWWITRRADGAPAASAPPDDQSPLRVGSALRMTVALQAVLMTIRFVERELGNPGVIGSAAVLGLTDMDALTFSMARLGTDPALTSLAGRAIGVGVLANTALKLGLTVMLGTAAFRRTASWGLAAMGAATGVGLWLAS